MIARKIHYSGRVQGVGFRYTAGSIAAGFAVAGYVRNLDNGEVEMVAQGAAAEIDQFLAALDQALAGYIESRRVEDEAAGEFAGFEIRR